MAAWACELPKGVDPSQIVPTVWKRAAAAAQFAPKGGKVTPTQDINEELTAVFAENKKSVLSYFRVPASQAACWKERGTLARHLSVMVRQIQAINTTQSPEGVMTVDAGGQFDSGLILAHPILVRASGWSVEPLAVGIPARDQLLVADPRQAQAIGHLKEMVAKAYRERHNAISDQVFLVSSCQISVLKDSLPVSEQGHACTH
ncbi:hypothetical protein EIP75_18195 [Aquabacterium soli]|uniref:Uncharacterized protein n=1 Tax=Aquabacterium soli TaxID=2493092 RepID=A0A426V7Y1_9BURK|nr:hypothetical protein [Aquabacterium soli]RRS02890.1 hypothetical protein EIP75_18195 [Aquabacterium soli]